MDIATREHEAPGVVTTWKVQLGEKRYTVHTYPNTSHIYVLSSANRALTSFQAKSLAPRILAAIAKVEPC